jgi:microcystin-dependent protein
MASNIDPSKPTTGSATTASVRDNFQYAKDEIEALQSDVINAQSTADAAAAAAAAAAMAAMTTIYPIGAIYISTLVTNPNILLGFGTWSAFAAGQVMVGQDTGQTEFDTLEETGGEKTHTLTTAELASHNHTQDAHTHTQNSHNHTQDAHTHTQNSHNHTQDAHSHTERFGGNSVGSNPMLSATNNLNAANTNSGNSTATATATNQAATATNQNTTATNQAATATNQNTTATNQATGGGGAHNNLQPYIVIKAWKRTA